jgi:hypothetical protein
MQDTATRDMEDAKEVRPDESTNAPVERREDIRLSNRGVGKIESMYTAFDSPLTLSILWV